MKKTACLMLAIALLAGGALAAGRLTSVTVSESGTVMLATGNPNEFKSSWSGQPGQYKMIIELPGVTVDKTAQVLGNLATNRGIKNVRFSQFQTEPPVARVIIETPERLSYSWSTKPDGVELHFMLPSPLSAPTGTTPTATGFAVPANAFLQTSEGYQPTAAGKRLTPPSAGSTRQATEAATVSPSKNEGAKIGSTVTGSKPTPVVSASTPKTVVSPTSKKTNGSSTKASDSAAKPGSVTVAPPPAGTTGKQSVTTETVKPGTTPSVSTTAGPPAPTLSGSAAISGKSVATVKAPTSGPQKDSAPTGAISSPQGKTGTTMSAKSAPSAGTSSVPTSGGTGVVVKPSSPVLGQPAPTHGAPASVEKPKTTAGAPTVTAPTAAKPGSAGMPVVSTTTGKPAEAPKTTAAKPTTGPPPPTGVAVTKPAVSGGATDTVNQEKFKEQLKKALGKLDTPAQPAGTKPAETGPKTAAPAGKPDQTSFQEQLKQALDPAKSLADTGEVADVDDIDTDLPATDDEEEEPYDTSFAFPGGTFMQVSPSRKVIRYHSEGRRDPFSPLTGRDRYASGKKRRAVPAAEQLRLVGIMRSLAGNKAVLEDGEGNGYLLAPGDRVRNGYLVSVSENKVLFQVTEYGWTKTVAMELGNLE
ncbi:MAG: hypothetical protein L0Z48_01700 [candidate division Zixibacteria bacterium]|nr:hypothetical protein [candidate division Zixibacteria bacterium]